MDEGSTQFCGQTSTVLLSSALPSSFFLWRPFIATAKWDSHMPPQLTSYHSRAHLGTQQKGALWQQILVWHPGKAINKVPEVPAGRHWSSQFDRPLPGGFPRPRRAPFFSIFGGIALTGIRCNLLACQRGHRKTFVSRLKLCESSQNHGLPATFTELHSLPKSPQVAGRTDASC